jgi:hypothetical protein
MDNCLALGAEAEISPLAIASFEPMAHDLRRPDARALCMKNSSPKRRHQYMHPSQLHSPLTGVEIPADAGRICVFRTKERAVERLLTSGCC